MNPKKIIYVALALFALVLLSRLQRDEPAPPILPPPPSGAPSVDTDGGEDSGFQDTDPLQTEIRSDEETGRAPEAPGVEAPSPVLQVPEIRVPEIPGQPRTFKEWLALEEPEGSKDREIWLGRGWTLARARQPVMRSLIRENPEQALREAVSPRRFAALPPEIQELVERPVAEEGVFGVAMDGHIARHQDDVVIVDDGDLFETGRFAVYYRGEVHFAETREAAEEIRASLQPDRSEH